MVQESLKKLGFNEKEIDVYLAILQHGSMTPAEVSKITRINRTTIYSTTKELVKKGLIQEDLGGSTRKLIAASPKVLEQLHEREIAKLDDKKNYVMRAVRELGAFTQDSKYSVPKIVFVQEEDVEEHLYKQTPLWNESIRKNKAEYLGYQDSSFVEHYESWIDWYWTQDHSKDIVLKLFSNEKAEQIKKKKFERRMIRFWNKIELFTATTWIMGDYVTMIVTDKRPHYLVEICDATLAHNMRELFKALWEEVIENPLKIKKQKKS